MREKEAEEKRSNHSKKQSDDARSRESRSSRISSDSSNQAEGSADDGGGEEAAVTEGAASGTRATAGAEEESRAAVYWVDGAEGRCRSGASPGSLASRSCPSRSGQHVLSRHVRSVPPHGYWQPTPSCEHKHKQNYKLLYSVLAFAFSRET